MRSYKVRGSLLLRVVASACLVAVSLLPEWTAIICSFLTTTRVFLPGSFTFAHAAKVTDLAREDGDEPKQEYLLPRPIPVLLGATSSSHGAKKSEYYARRLYASKNPRPARLSSAALALQRQSKVLAQLEFENPAAFKLQSSMEKVDPESVGNVVFADPRRGDGAVSSRSATSSRSSSRNNFPKKDLMQHILHLWQKERITELNTQANSPSSLLSQLPIDVRQKVLRDYVAANFEDPFADAESPEMRRAFEQTLKFAGTWHRNGLERNCFDKQEKFVADVWRKVSEKVWPKVARKLPEHQTNTGVLLQQRSSTTSTAASGQPMRNSPTFFPQMSLQSDLAQLEEFAAQVQGLMPTTTQGSSSTAGQPTGAGHQPMSLQNSSGSSEAAAILIGTSSSSSRRERHPLVTVEDDVDPRVPDYVFDGHEDDEVDPELGRGQNTARSSASGTMIREVRDPSPSTSSSAFTVSMTANSSVLLSPIIHQQEENPILEGGLLYDPHRSMPDQSSPAGTSTSAAVFSPPARSSPISTIPENSPLHDENTTTSRSSTSILVPSNASAATGPLSPWSTTTSNGDESEVVSRSSASNYSSTPPSTSSSSRFERVLRQVMATPLLSAGTMAEAELQIGHTLTNSTAATSNGVGGDDRDIITVPPADQQDGSNVNGTTSDRNRFHLPLPPSQTLSLPIPKNAAHGRVISIGSVAQNARRALTPRTSKQPPWHHVQNIYQEEPQELPSQDQQEDSAEVFTDEDVIQGTKMLSNLWRFGPKDLYFPVLAIVPRMNLNSRGFSEEEQNKCFGPDWEKHVIVVDADEDTCDTFDTTTTNSLTLAGHGLAIGNPGNYHVQDPRALFCCKEEHDAGMTFWAQNRGAPSVDLTAITSGTERTVRAPGRVEDNAGGEVQDHVGVAGPGTSTTNPFSVQLAVPRTTDNMNNEGRRTEPRRPGSTTSAAPSSNTSSQRYVPLEMASNFFHEAADQEEGRAAAAEVQVGEDHVGVEGPLQATAIDVHLQQGRLQGAAGEVVELAQDDHVEYDRDVERRASQFLSRFSRMFLQKQDFSSSTSGKMNPKTTAEKLLHMREARVGAVVKWRQLLENIGELLKPPRTPPNSKMGLFRAEDVFPFHAYHAQHREKCPIPRFFSTAFVLQVPYQY
ncbi:unnamed protein product [Amoebophrya sp. A120]|nr:unnamed protein product [Amoebophrya sp. A120]|eukprot:GSA120T00023169001.1